jgi:senataxin
MLSVQYRMHPEIRKFPSEAFYQDKLVDAPQITQEIEEFTQSGIVPECGVVLSRALFATGLAAMNFLDLESQEERIGKSIKNEHEVRYIMSLIDKLGTHLKGLSLAIIAPYKSQVNRLKQALRDLKRPPAPSVEGSTACSSGLADLNCEVNTIDGFQGREKDVVIFSCVRSSRGGIGFVSDERRMNVAITRARRCLIIVGDSRSLSNDAMWGQLLKSLVARSFVRKVKHPFSFDQLQLSTPSPLTNSNQPQK